MKACVEQNNNIEVNDTRQQMEKRTNAKEIFIQLKVCTLFHRLFSCNLAALSTHTRLHILNAYQNIKMAIGIIDELFLLLSSLFFYLDLNVTFTAQTSVLQSISLICAGNLCLIDDNLWLWQFSLVFNASELECFKRLN